MHSGMAWRASSLGSRELARASPSEHCFLGYREPSSHTWEFGGDASSCCCGMDGVTVASVASLTKGGTLKCHWAAFCWALSCGFIGKMKLTGWLHCSCGWGWQLSADKQLLQTLTNHCISHHRIEGLTHLGRSSTTLQLCLCKFWAKTSGCAGEGFRWDMHGHRIK